MPPTFHGRWRGRTMGVASNAWSRASLGRLLHQSCALCAAIIGGTLRSSYAFGARCTQTVFDTASTTHRSRVCARGLTSCSRVLAWLSTWTGAFGMAVLNTGLLQSRMRSIGYRSCNATESETQRRLRLWWTTGGPSCAFGSTSTRVLLSNRSPRRSSVGSEGGVAGEQ